MSPSSLIKDKHSDIFVCQIEGAIKFDYFLVNNMCLLQNITMSFGAEKQFL